jgi:hypothetical protein
VFLENSRYFKVKTLEAEDRKGRKVTAIVLRRLPYAPGTEAIVKGNDRLDVLSQTKYADPTKFWHIADANTELQANDLINERPWEKEAHIILVPDS